MPILLLVLAAIAFPAPAGGIEITILYNNVPHAPDCRCQWGFACLVRGAEETILFDTGGDGRVLLANMQRLGVDPGEIDCVVLSHSHGDHTGGVRELLPQLKPAIICIPLKAESDLEIALLVNLITMTPGSLSMDISTDRRAVYVHVLDNTEPETVKKSIQEGLQKKVRELFQ